MVKLLSLFFLLTISVSASAVGLLVEPYATYANLTMSGTATMTGLEFKLDEESVKGPLLGGRAGVGIGDFALGVDYTGTIGGDDEDVKVNNLGGFGMYVYSIFRVWGTYFFNSTYKTYNKDFATDFEFSGSGTKFGIGAIVFPAVSLNIEYMSVNYDKENMDLFEAVDADLKGLLLSVSFPFVL